jgi:hypothetical protein
MRKGKRNINNHKGISKKAMGAADVILVGEGLLCLIVLFYCIYYYSWTHARLFSSPISPILFYGLLVIMASLLFGALRLHCSYKLNCVLLLISIEVSIVAAELLFPFVNNVLVHAETEKVLNAAIAAGVIFDTRSKREVVTALQQQGIMAVPTVFPSILLKQQVNGTLQSAIRMYSTEVLPLAGIARKTTVFCNESGDYTIYKSDEHGFHNPQGMWQAGRMDIVAVGDSFTMGACVPSDKNFVALIRRHWPATLNLGSYGSGPLIELAILREYAQFLKPRIVLWCYFEGNDLQDLRREKDSPLLMRYVESDFTQGLLARQTEIDQALTAYVDMVKNDHRPSSMSRLQHRVGNVFKLRRLRQHLGRVAQRRVSEAEMDLLRTILLEAKASVGAWGGQLYFVYLPDWPRYARPAMTNKDREGVLTIVNRLRLPLIDIHHAFQAQNDPLALFPFRQRLKHYTEVGNQLVAEEILQSIYFGSEAVRPPVPSVRGSGGMTKALATQ